MVAALRLRPEFDSELSVVAEVDGQAVGHALFNPFTVRLLGQEVRAVNLAPIAIAPAHQRRGLGAELIRLGHARAAEKGYAFSSLLGHPSYYPRFGYQPRAYGNSSLTLATADWPLADWEVRRPRLGDVEMLSALWRDAEGAVDFAIEPGRALLDWLSPSPNVESLVFSADGNIVGYVRALAAELNQPRIFLARTAEATRGMSAHLARKATAATVTLPLHPASAAAQGLGACATEAWEAAMVCPLRPSAYDDYRVQLDAGLRPPGRPFWPTAFDFDS